MNRNKFKERINLIIFILYTFGIFAMVVIIALNSPKDF